MANLGVGNISNNSSEARKFYTNLAEKAKTKGI
jgi:hypothetical protein